MISISPLRAIAQILVFTLLFGACKAAPIQESRKESSLLSSGSSEMQQKIDLSVKKQLNLISTPAIENYLAKIASRLFSEKNTQDHMKVFLVSSNKNFKKNVWIIPPKTGYFDLEILKKISYENEIAALLAFNWERALSAEFENRFFSDLQTGHEKQDIGSVFEFSLEENESAIGRTVDRLYRAGYDPRGVNRILSLKSINVPTEQLSHLKNKTLQFLSLYQPLKNPIIRTREFYSIQRIVKAL